MDTCLLGVPTQIYVLSESNSGDAKRKCGMKVVQGFLTKRGMTGDSQVS